MASALLANRTEPVWGDRQVYARKTPNPNPNPSSNSSRKPKNHNPNSNPNANYSVKKLNYGRKMEDFESVSTSASDDLSEFGNGSNRDRRKESISNGVVTYNIAAYTKSELRDLKKQLVAELEEIRKLRNRIEMGGSQLSGREAGDQMPKHKQPKKRPLPVDGPTVELVAGMMEQCGKMLKKLMGHKFGWVFNVPVDVVGMGLHDYNQIIKQPMDLGTVKSKFERKLYCLPDDFAADVRLTFNNALTYNPVGHDVFVMAKQLLATFEKMYGPAYKKFENERHRIAAMASQEMKWEKEQRVQERQRPKAMPVDEMKWEREAVSYEERGRIHSSSPTPTSEAATRHDPVPSPPAKRRLPPVPTPVEPAAPAIQSTQPVMDKTINGKLPKPKARDAFKREMTFEEKQKLSKELQNLPPEKMDQAVQLMRRRNAALSQDDDDEIEVDFEVLDRETLWELDRFVGNYRKTISKMRRQHEVEIDQHASPMQQGNKSPESEMTEAAVAFEKTKKIEAVCVEEDIDIGEDIPTNNYPPIEIEKDVVGNASSSSGSSSDSSSSSDSDSGSSSDSDSDADDAQSPCIQSKELPKS